MDRMMPNDPLAMAREPVKWTAVDGGGNCYSWGEAERHHRANLPTQGCARACTRAPANGAAQGLVLVAGFFKYLEEILRHSPSRRLYFSSFHPARHPKIKTNNSTAQEMDRVIQENKRNCVAAI
jgi:hypothetical protein